jgi:ferrous iron transport protein B
MTPTVLLIGNPNSGKTTLFNALTGLSAKVGNYPGITVEHREGTASVGHGHDAVRVNVVDVPGTYSLVPRSEDESVAVRALFGAIAGVAAPDVVVVVVDATQLERNLFLVAQLRELPLPLVVALTMTDTVEKDGGHVDAAALAAHVGVPVVAAPATRGGADALRALLADELAMKRARLPLNVAVDVTAVGADLAAAVDAAGRSVLRLVKGNAVAARALGTLVAHAAASGDDGHGLFADADTRGLTDKRALAELATRGVQARYARASAWAQAASASPAAPASTKASTSTNTPTASTKTASTSQTRTARLDAIALHALLGPLLLVSVFGALFFALFSGAEPLVGAIEGGVAFAQEHVGAWVPASLPLVRSLLTDGVVAGVGNVVVFVPQIAILFLFLAVLEDSGYLARAAFLLDRLMAGVGLHGRAFVPLLSGFACAVPAILATRTIENEKDRIVTILVTPLVSCSARLPVYALMIATVFSTTPPLLGVVPVGVVVMFAMYGLSLFAAVTMARVFKSTLLRSPTPPLVLELPPYRLPHAKALWLAVWSRVKTFLTEAGTVILAITVVLWALLRFPVDDAVVAHADAARAKVAASVVDDDAKAAAVAAIDADERRLLVERSAAGRLGHALEPVIAPLGFDWKMGIGIIASFAAREVFVSTLGIVYGLGDAEDEESTTLRESMQRDRRADGTPIYTPLTGLSLMVFFVLAMQCMSTIAAVKRETRSWRWPLFQVAYMTALAFLSSLAVYQIGTLAGFGAP